MRFTPRKRPLDLQKLVLIEQFIANIKQLVLLIINKKIKYNLILKMVFL